MKVEVSKVSVVNLVMTEREAKLLASMVQNSRFEPDDEPREEAEFRRELFNAITGGLTGEADRNF